MDIETKKRIMAAFSMLRSVLVTNGCSLASDNKGVLYVFSTEEYKKKGKLTECSGIFVNLKDLVR